MENNFEKNTEKEKGENIIREKLRKLVDIKDNDLFSKIQKEIGDFASKLRGKYPDFQDYSYYHFMAGSTIRGKCPKEDFPGEDSVEKFMNSLDL